MHVGLFRNPGSPLSRDRKGCGTYFGLRLMQYEKMKNKNKGQRFFFIPYYFNNINSKYV